MKRNHLSDLSETKFHLVATANVVAAEIVSPIDAALVAAGEAGL